MWNNTRRGFNLIRWRNNARQSRAVKNKSIGIIASIFTVFLLFTITIVYFKVKPSSSENGFKDSDVSQASNSYVNIYNDNAKEDEPQKEDDSPKNNNNENTSTEKVFSFVALGEVMMGGSDNANYVLSFKDVSQIAQEADYTVTSLTTNIVNLDKIEDPKSKYIVTKNILKAFNALGIDGVNIASDHMLDFGKNIFNGTKTILSDAKLDIIGIQDDIIYAEHDGIKVAFIGVSNEIIGSYSSFTDAGIWVYDNYMTRIKTAIKRAKESADTVVIMTHLGSENSHEVTSVMTWFYHELANAGADLILGNHALGVYPIEMYKNVPIIYSLGYFMHDTTYDIGKKSGIFKFTIDVKGKIRSLEFTPTYITEDGVKLYSEYNSSDALEFMKYVANYNNSSANYYDVSFNNKNMSIKFK